MLSRSQGQPTCASISTPAQARPDRPRPAAITAGDWDLCEDCYNAVTAPDPEECNEPAF